MNHQYIVSVKNSDQEKLFDIFIASKLPFEPQDFAIRQLIL